MAALYWNAGVAALAALATLVATAAAQDSGGRLAIEVRSGGRPVSGAKVTVVGPVAGVTSVTPEQNEVTDTTGGASLLFDAGIYTVRIEAGGRYGTRTVFLAPGTSQRVLFNVEELPPVQSVTAVRDRGVSAKSAGDAATAAAALQDLEREAVMAGQEVQRLEESISRFERTMLDDLPRDTADQLRSDLAAARSPADADRAFDNALNHPSMTARKLTDPRAHDRDAKTLDRLRGWRSMLDGRRQRVADVRAAIDDVRRAEGPRGAGLGVPFPGSAGFGSTGPVPGAPGFYANLGTGAAFIDVPTVTYGTIVNVPGVFGTETPVARSDGGLAGWRLALGMDVPITRQGTVSGQIAYRHAEEEASAGVDVGGPRVATVYFDRAPNGSTGVSLGQTGADVKIESVFSKLAFYAQYSHDVTDLLLGAPARGHDGHQARIGLGLAFQRVDLSHDAVQTSRTFNDIRSSADIDGETHVVGPRLEAGLSCRMDWGVPFSFGIEGYVVPGYAFGSGTARQRSICPLCPAAERDLTIARDQDRSGFALIAGFTGRVAVDVTDRIQLGVEGGFEHTNTLYSWRIPVSPVEQPARLGSDSLDVGFVGVSVRWAF